VHHLVWYTAADAEAFAMRVQGDGVMGIAACAEGKILDKMLGEGPLWLHTSLAAKSNEL